jgi:CHAD domain-containing protein
MNSKSKALSSAFSKSTKQLSKRADAFLVDSNPDNIHDLRTSLRKVLVGLELLPGNLRKRSRFKKYRSACKSLFKSTNPLRDNDVVYARLGQNRSISTVKEAMKTLALEREKLLHSAKDEARSLLKLKIPRVRTSKLSEKGVTKRLDKLLAESEGKLRTSLPVVLSDPRKIDEMHDFRKHCKTVRYTLEMIPTYKSRADTQHFLDLLRKWQSLLGDVRDNDMIEEFIQSHKLESPLSRILANTRAERDKKFSSFTHSAKTESATGSSILVSPQLISS